MPCLPQRRASRRAALAFAVMAVLTAGLARAHDTWLSVHRGPASSQAPSSLSLRLTTGHSYPSPESPVRPERIARSRWRRGDLEGEASTGVPQDSYTPVDVPEPALAQERAVPLQVGLSLHPLRIELREPKVSQYLNEVACEGAARLAWDDAAPGVRWLEDYRKHAVCWVNADEAHLVATPQPMGLDLELIPEVDPGALRPGATLRVQARRRSRPLADFAVFLVGARDSKPVLRHTDGEGWASWTVVGTGPHLVKGTLIRPPTAEGVWVSDFTTFSFEVRR